MEFGEQIKAARLAAKLSQSELAKRAGLSARAIQYYETNQRQPRNASAIVALAKALGVGTEYFLADAELEKAQREEDFLEEAKREYGARGRAQARLLLNQTAALFAGGALDEGDQEEFMRTMNEIYFDAKARARGKFAKGDEQR